MDQSNVHLPMQKCFNGCEVKTLSDIELIAVILNTGTSGKNVINLAADVYNKCRGLHGIRKSGLRELAMLKGVGFAKAVRIQCALVIHPREIFREAIKESASSIIVAHNHPSGSLKPSEEDLRATKRLANAGEIVGIPLLDHLIVCEDSFLSMKEEGYL